MQDQKRARPAPLDPYRIVRIPATVYPPAAGIVGGLAGGLGMIPFAAAYGWMSGHGLWYPVNLVASTLIRDWQHATPAQLEKPSVEGILVAVLIHLIMSMGLGLSFAVLLPGACPATRCLGWHCGPPVVVRRGLCGLASIQPRYGAASGLGVFWVGEHCLQSHTGAWVAGNAQGPRRVGQPPRITANREMEIPNPKIRDTTMS